MADANVTLRTGSDFAHLLRPSVYLQSSTALPPVHTHNRELLRQALRIRAMWDVGRGESSRIGRASKVVENKLNWHNLYPFAQPHLVRVV